MRNRYKKVFFATAVGIILSVYFYQQMITISRPFNLSVEGQSNFFWHNLYNGFGFLQNKIGITGDSRILYYDLLQESVVKHQSYILCAKNRVLNLCKKHPFVFLSIFFAKGAIIFFYFIICGGWLGLFIACFYPQSILFKIFSFLFLSIAALPAFCLEPTLQHMWHFIYATVLYVAVSIVWLFFCRKDIHNNKNL